MSAPSNVVVSIAVMVLGRRGRPWVGVLRRGEHSECVGELSAVIRFRLVTAPRMHPAGCVRGAVTMPAAGAVSSNGMTCAG